MASRPHLIIFGPPGAGKSTQTQLLVARWPIAAISTGKMLRGEVAAKTALGEQVRETLAHGDLINDELMVATVRNWLVRLPEDRGFLLDGFPRTVVQAQMFEAILQELDRPLTAIIDLRLSVSEAVYRLGGRRLCYGVGAEEIIHINDEQAVARCLDRGGLLVQRPDDLPNVIVRRLNVYEAETQGVLDYYAARKLTHSIDAAGSPDEVAQRIDRVLGAPPKHNRAPKA